MVKLPIFEVNLKPIKNYIAGAAQPVHHWCSGMVRAPTATSSLRWHVDVQTRPKFRRTGACSGSAASSGQLHIAGPLGAFDVVEDCEAARDNSRELLAVGGGLPILPIGMNGTGIVNLADAERLLPAPLGLSGRHNRREKVFPDPSRRATDTTSIPRLLKLTMPSAELCVSGRLNARKPPADACN
jgi:hypothetical protein